MPSKSISMTNLEPNHGDNMSMISATSMSSVNSISKKRRAPAPPKSKKVTPPIHPAGCVIPEETPSLLRTEEEINQQNLREKKALLNRADTAEELDLELEPPTVPSTANNVMPKPPKTSPPTRTQEEDKPVVPVARKRTTSPSPAPRSSLTTKPEAAPVKKLEKPPEIPVYKSKRASDELDVNANVAVVERRSKSSVVHPVADIHPKHRYSSSNPTPSSGNDTNHDNNNLVMIQYYDNVVRQPVVTQTRAPSVLEKIKMFSNDGQKQFPFDRVPNSKSSPALTRESPRQKRVALAMSNSFSNSIDLCQTSVAKMAAEFEKFAKFTASKSPKMKRQSKPKRPMTEERRRSRIELFKQANELTIEDTDPEDPTETDLRKQKAALAAEVEELMNQALEGHDEPKRCRLSKLKSFEQKRINHFAERLHERNKGFIHGFPLDDNERLRAKRSKMKEMGSSTYHWDDATPQPLDEDKLDLNALTHFPTTPAHVGMSQSHVVQELRILQKPHLFIDDGDDTYRYEKDECPAEPVEDDLDLAELSKSPTTLRNVGLVPRLTLNDDTASIKSGDYRMSKSAKKAALSQDQKWNCFLKDVKTLSIEIDDDNEAFL